MHPKVLWAVMRITQGGLGDHDKVKTRFDVDVSDLKIDREGLFEIFFKELAEGLEATILEFTNARDPFSLIEQVADSLAERANELKRRTKRYHDFSDGYDAETVVSALRDLLVNDGLRSLTPVVAALELVVATNMMVIVATDERLRDTFNKST
jgi:hypothetical protein